MIRDFKRWLGRVLLNLIIGAKAEIVRLDNRENHDYIFVFEENVSDEEASRLHDLIDKMVHGDVVLITGSVPTILGFTNEHRN